MTTAVGSAVDSSVYYENAYDSVTVGTDADIASITISRAISLNGANLLFLGYVLCIVFRESRIV
jgi:hypothetical protein